MHRKERYHDLEEMLETFAEALQTRIYTMLPCVVSRFPGSAGAMTVDVQPTVNGVYRDLTGNRSAIGRPILSDCPLIWIGGGGVTFTFPIKKGDEGCVFFSARCIDSWFQNGYQAPAAGQPFNPANNLPSLRMHDLSDGFALIGVRSLPRQFTPDPDAAAMTSDDQTTFVKLNPTAQTVVVTAPGGADFNGVSIDSSGNISTAGNISSTGGAVHAHTEVTVNGTPLTVP